MTTTSPGRPPNLCYIHIYKCGGSSLRQHITEHLISPRTTLIDQWAYSWEGGVNARDSRLGNFARAEYLREASRSWTPEQHIVVLTHSFFYAFMTRWRGFSFVTLLRDPVKRLLSQFHFQKRTFELCRDDELPSWLDAVSSFQLNLQTAALCGAPAEELTPLHLEMAKANLHHFDFIGFVDDYTAALALFGRLYGTPAPETVPWLNASPSSGDLPAGVAARLRERCRLDVELIEYARRLYLAKLAALDMITLGPETLPPALARPAD